MTSASTGLCFSGIGVVLRGLPADLATRLAADWAPFVGDAGDGPFLTLEVGVHGQPAPGATYRPKAMTSRFEGVVAVFSMPEGEVRVESHGVGSITLRRFTDGREYHTLRNLLRAALAWSLPNRGGALLHAAALAIDGRGFVLVGPEGSGKTSWARLGEQAGARVISDDLVLVDGIGPRPELLGAPFRSTWTGSPAPIRVPLERILFPRHGEPATVKPVGGIRSRARLLANLPFVADALQSDRRVAAVLERLCRTVPCAELTYGLDTTFVARLRELTR